MYKSFLDLLNKRNIVVNVDEEAENEILKGELKVEDEVYKIEYGVPDFTQGIFSSEQELTNKTFSFKWGEGLTEYDIATVNVMTDFVIKRLKPLGIYNFDDYKEFISQKKKILEVGAGNGWMSRILAENTQGEVVAAEIGEGAYSAYQNCVDKKNCHIIRADLMNLPFENGTFDYIHADGVLHHTPDCKQAMKACYDKLKEGGVFWAYIYKEMNPVKHYCDDWIRDIFGKMSPEEALEECKAITELGQQLSNLNVSFELKRPINVLNIPAGKYNLQRFIHYNLLKCYWNEEAGYDVSNMTNFDWFHPNSASQHSIEEVEGWIREWGIKKYELFVANPNGINVFLYK